MTKTVVITTSGTGSRLNSLTKYTNKSLINIGDKYAICYIIDNYEINTEFIITIGYCGELVKEFLLLSYPYHNFTFVTIDKYEGDGSSLGYSLLQAKQYLQKPFMFHCCDAIVIDKLIFEEKRNILCLSKHISSEHYTNVKVNNEEITEINDKNHSNFDYVYTGICFFYDYVNFWKNLENLYNSNMFNKNLNDVDAIRLMINGDNCVFNYNILNNWYDSGNIESYEKLKQTFQCKYTIIDKNNESLCFFDDIVIKFVNDKDINNKRIERGKYLFPLSPKIINSSNNFIVMEKINGINLSEYYNYGEIYKLLVWAINNLWVEKYQDKNFIKNCYNFYFNKTINRINNLNFLKNHNEINIINGINVGSIDKLLNNHLFKEIILTETFYSFHGDFILDNIIKTKDSYCLIDWRHEFDIDQLKYGDIYYDLSKLRHSIIFNHKNILNELYEIVYNNDNINIDLKCNYFLMQQLSYFDKFINENNFNLNKIKIITSIIWINMSPLYNGKLSEFLFYFGKYNLYLSLNNI
jgi:NDP-sugar pyrophosphorylase family protein